VSHPVSKWKVDFIHHVASGGVVLHPGGSNFPHFLKVFKQVSIEHVVQEGAIEALYKSVLGRLARLDVYERYLMHLASSGHRTCDKFRPDIHSDAPWLFPFLH
jgi:hypothetical protein